LEREGQISLGKRKKPTGAISSEWGGWDIILMPRDSWKEVAERLGELIQDRNQFWNDNPGFFSLKIIEVLAKAILM
jgi:hypothetical protein